MKLVSRSTAHRWLRHGVAVVLALASVMMASMVSADSGTTAAVLPGDVDGNGVVDLEDSKLISTYVVGGVEFLPYPDAADATQDGKITVEDALAIAQRVEGKSLTVVASTGYGSQLTNYVGSWVRIDVSERFFPLNVTGGAVRIKSPSTGYDSGNQPLVVQRDGRSLVFYWNTSGLAPAADYGVYVVPSTHDMIVALVVTPVYPTTPYVTVELSPRVFQPAILAEAQDAYSPAPGIALDFRRVFPQDPAHAPYLGSFGRGWSHSFDVFLQEFADGRVAFFGSDGFNRCFVSDGDGTYSGAPGEHGVLTRDPDGTYQLREKNGLIYRFRSDLRLNFMQDSKGNRISCTYDSASRLVEVAHSSGSSLRLEYNSLGRVSKLTDDAGRQTTYQYSSEGVHLVKVTAPDGSATSYTYCLGQAEASDHRLASITYPDGTHLSCTYDSKGRLASQEGDAGTGRIVYSYDADGTMHLTDAMGGVTTVWVNENGQPTEVVDQLGHENRYDYDSNLNLTKVTDPLGKAYLLVYDERGNVIQFTDPLGNQSKFGYDPVFNNIAWFKDSLGRLTTFSYNAQGNLTAITYPDGSAEKFAYGGDHQLDAKTNGDGQVIRYDFDSLGLLLSKTYPDANIDIFTYDEMGRLVAATNTTGAVGFEYDSANNVVQATYPGNRIFQYEYDRAGKRTRMTDPDGAILAYQYDGAGRLSKIADGDGTTVVLYQYDAANRRTLKTLGNGVYTTYEYDAAGQTLRLTNYGPAGNVISSFNYTYDAAGNRLSKETIEGTENYTYDAVGQLTGVAYPDGTTTQFVYDAMGNRLQVLNDGVATNYTVNNLNQYTSVGAAVYGYDADGNLISKAEWGQTTYYDYDFESHLVAVRTPTETISYAYDAFGLRNSRTDSSGTARYLWDGAQVAIEEDEAHQTIASYVWGDVLDEAVRMERVGSQYYYAQDAMLSVSDLMNTSGNIVEHYQYRAFGEPLTSSSMGNSWLFTGSPYDFRTSLQYNRFRWYSSAQGRFTSNDPVGLFGGFNLYTYARNNPVFFTDPLGLLVPDPLDPSCMPDPKAFKPPSLVDLPRLDIDPPRWLPSPGHIAVYHGWAVMNIGGRLYPGATCPTFIQLPSELENNTSLPTHLDVSGEELAAEITVPVGRALLRSDIPIFGVAGGTNFKEYRVEYGIGTNPTKWNLIESSKTPQQTCEVGLAEMQLMQGDIDIRGNLATWNTGLKEWVHLPWHPPEDPTDLNGIYTLRLTVVGKDKSKVQDSMVVEIGRVIAQCLPGTAASPDGKVTMRFPEQSLTEAFRVYTILPLKDVGEETPALPEGVDLVGAAYQIREPGDRFTKDVTLEFEASAKDLGGHEPARLGIMRYDNAAKQWVWLSTSYQANDEKTLYSTTLTELPTPQAIYALGYDSGSTRSQLAADKPPKESLTPVSTGILMNDTFENGMGYWASRDRFLGPTLDLAKVGPGGSSALKITNPTLGGSFGVTVMDRSFDVRDYPVMTFDYRIGPGVKTDFYVLVNGRWYNLGFADDPVNFKNRDVNIGNIGRIDSIVADDQWHSALVNIYELLRQKTRNTRVDAIMMGDWDVDGYMKLGFGNNGTGVAYYLDNFKIAAASEYDRSQVVTVDGFDLPDSLNTLGGEAGTFWSPEKGWWPVVSIEDATPAAKAGNRVLQLDFDVSQDGAYCGYWTSLMGRDLEDMSEVSFRLYAPGVVPPMQVGLSQQAWVEAKTLIAPYIGPADDSGWRLVTIPLSAFRGLPPLSTTDKLLLIFAKEIGSGKGTVLIDDIEFRRDPSYAEVCDFGVNGTDYNLLGGEFSTAETEAAVISYGYHEDSTTTPSTGAVRISYGGMIGLDYGQGRFSYGMWETGLSGFDARGYKSLVLRVRGETGGEEPNIWLDDGTTRRCIRAKEIAPLSTSWQDIYIPIDKLAAQGLDLSHLEDLEVVFEWKEMTGTIYVSQIRFSAQQAPSYDLTPDSEQESGTGDNALLYAGIGLGTLVLVVGIGVLYILRRRNNRARQVLN